ncbi:CYFA0S01e19240g1_1 [Cyberlindnera fabianii]|uniref:CYFA0S01e19240g1_1 n=1 Tax=Cyberlindnera fabianii TaxID=36022 RepID=A0A061ALB1_CYBFA|nr:CYFA0S01e19240g1_1 [Cyberlindnera fabianii]
MGDVSPLSINSSIARHLDTNKVASQLKRRRLDIPDIPDIEKEQVTIDFPWLSKIVGTITSTLAENSTQRDKYPNEPLRFLDTETALYAQVKELSNITENPSLLEDPQLLIKVLPDLLSHPNEDIVEQSTITLSDFIDHEYEPFSESFISWLLSTKILQNLLLKSPSIQKLSLQMIAELCEYESYKEQVQLQLTEDVFLFLSRINEQTSTPDMTETLYDVIYRLVSIDISTFCTKFPFAIEILLVTLSKMINRDYTPDLEPIEDIVDSLGSCLTDHNGYDSIVHYEGFELFVLLMKKTGEWGFLTFLKLAGLAMDSLNKRSNVDLSLDIVRSNHFLKSVFKFYNSGNEKSVIQVFVGLMVFLPFGSDERVRVINRLVSKEGKGVKTILKTTSKTDSAVLGVNGTYDFDDLYLEKIEAGLDLIQKVVLLFAWLLIEDDELKAEIVSYGVDIKKINVILRSYEAELVFNYDNAQDENKEDSLETLSMVRELLAHLE